jgi:Cupredoxin-like domain
LKEDLPAPAYDYVWVRVNPAELYPYGKAATEDALAATLPPGQEGRPRPESHSLNPGPVTAPVAEAAREREAPRAQQNDAEVRTAPPEKKDSPTAVAGEAPAREENQAGKEETQATVAEAKTREEPRMRSEKTKVQTARVVLTEQGYKPDIIRLRQGIPARITFLRQAEGSCGTEVVLPDQGIRRALPLNKPVAVAFTPNKSGEFSFTCGMGMLRGKIVVQEK